MLNSKFKLCLEKKRRKSWIELIGIWLISLLIYTKWESTWLSLSIGHRTLPNAWCASCTKYDGRNRCIEWDLSLWSRSLCDNCRTHTRWLCWQRMLCFECLERLVWAFDRLLLSSSSLIRFLNKNKQIGSIKNNFKCEQNQVFDSWQPKKCPNKINYMILRSINYFIDLFS